MAINRDDSLTPPPLIISRDESLTPKAKSKDSREGHQHSNQVKFSADVSDFTEISFEPKEVKQQQITIESKKVRPRTLREIKDPSLMDPAIILEKVDNLPIYKYHYKGGGKKIAMGPLPVDWHQAFPTEKDIQVLDPQDMTAVSLASIKALSQMVSTIWQTVLSINARLEELEASNQD